MNIRQKISKFAQYRRTLRELSQLEDRQLRDIGITRADFKAIANGHVL
jgi:uncharacterized protein YjiS (DUF1127 family)